MIRHQKVKKKKKRKEKLAILSVSYRAAKPTPDFLWWPSQKTSLPKDKCGETLCRKKQKRNGSERKIIVTRKWRRRIVRKLFVIKFNDNEASRSDKDTMNKISTSKNGKIFMYSIHNTDWRYRTCWVSKFEEFYWEEQK